MPSLNFLLKLLLEFQTYWNHDLNLIWNSSLLALTRQIEDRPVRLLLNRFGDKRKGLKTRWTTAYIQFWFEFTNGSSTAGHRTKTRNQQSKRKGIGMALFLTELHNGGHSSARYHLAKHELSLLQKGFELLVNQ